MIIARSPLRISLGGGGTDLPSYYREHTGFLISAAINRYVYIAVHQTFQPEIILKYSKMEHVYNIDDIHHPIIRESLRLLDIPEPLQLEISSMADITSGTGLGSSGSFTTALLKALHTYKRHYIHPSELAAQACHIELDKLKEPIGKQDQYIAAFGGITSFTFHPDERVEAAPLAIRAEAMHELEENLLMFFTGFTRSASAILKEQDDKSKTHDAGMVANLHHVKEMGYQTKAALEEGRLHDFAEIMNIHWQEKKRRSGSMSNAHIDEWYNTAMENGALGGKLIGAGGGGFLLFYSEDKIRLRKAMQGVGLTEVRFHFDFEGTKAVVQ